MMSDAEPKRRGRPRLDPTERKDGNMTFRTRGDLRQRLNEAAEKSGLTVSQEVERRLEASFQQESARPPEEVEYFRNIRMMFGGDEGLTEGVELGIFWRRMKDTFAFRHADRGEWFDNEENVRFMEEEFKGGVRRVLLGFAGRSKREAAKHDRK